MPGSEGVVHIDSETETQVVEEVRGSHIVCIQTLTPHAGCACSRRIGRSLQLKLIYRIGNEFIAPYAYFCEFGLAIRHNSRGFTT